MFNLIHTSSRPKYTVRTTMTSTDSGELIYETGFKPKGGHDFPATLPMINRGFCPFWSSESRYKGGQAFAHRNNR